MGAKETKINFGFITREASLYYMYILKQRPSINHIYLIFLIYKEDIKCPNRSNIYLQLRLLSLEKTKFPDPRLKTSYF